MLVINEKVENHEREKKYTLEKEKFRTSKYNI